MRNRAIVGFAVVCALLGCAVADHTLNVPPLKRYAQTLVTKSGAALVVDHCAMFDSSRKGFCLLRGTPDQVDRFAAGLSLAKRPPRRAYGTQSCLTFDDYGTADEGAYVSKANVRMFVASGPLPGNSENVRLVTVYARSTTLCVEMDYPYG